ncbi:putative surface protein with fasciclin (FAS1) repeats [Mucilaginibacter gracilis]|uniref:Putative surface protein with fasciclin (FAS1) repeats n=1 Tax=Mucilaginibacter gracilis TaxID=423350 RepID=A0A495J3N1_9SPHI|nr:fasciclin domain-containing protein [Mucilaginibacter gracilis]RKR82978.1 putative surface protein with fasciclin (FAS1) repeats [Mucilaginibacter gracilis]
MKKSILIVASTLCVGLMVNNTFAQTQDSTKTSAPTTTPGTTTVQATGDVVSTLSSNADYSTAATAAKAANLSAKLPATGTYTIFAPNNAAFSKLPANKLDSLMKDTAKLASVLKEHVVSGKYGKAEIVKALVAGKGKATLNTVDGETLKLAVTPNHTVQLTDETGNSAEVTLYDLQGTNGVVNGINSILMPK